MRILVTGGLGNIGLHVVEECLARGHEVAVFDLRSAANERLAGRLSRKRVEVRLGDIRDYEAVSAALRGREAVIHMAAILPPLSEDRPELCRSVNVEGTANLVRAALEASAAAGAGGAASKMAIVEVSSASVMGPTQDREPPVKPSDPLAPTDNYSRSKEASEKLVSESGLPFCLLRLAAVMPTYIGVGAVLGMVKVIFGMPLGARCEVVYDLDVAHALVSAAEDLRGAGKMKGTAAFIGGGRDKGCQIHIGEMLGKAFGSMGLGLPDEGLFPEDINSYYLDWYDTAEAQSILRYQRHSFGEWQDALRGRYRLLRPALAAFRKPVTRMVGRLSPRYGGQGRRR